MKKTVEDVMRVAELALGALNYAQRRRVLEDSISLYTEQGREDVVGALRERLEQEPPAEPASLAAARITRDAPETLAEFTGFVSLDDSPGCSSAGCRGCTLGMEVGILTARLDAKPQEWNGTYHAENAAILERVAKAKGYEAAFERSADAAWIFGTFTPLPPRPALRIVTDS